MTLPQARDILYGEFASTAAEISSERYFFRNHLGYSGTDKWVCRPVPPLPLTEHIRVEKDLQRLALPEAKPAEKEWIATMIGDLTPFKLVTVRISADDQMDGRRILRVKYQQDSAPFGYIDDEDFQRITDYYRTEPGQPGSTLLDHASWKWSPMLPDAIVLVGDLSATKMASIKLITQKADTDAG